MTKRPNDQTITINDRTHHIPHTWDDLSLHQLLTCYQIMMDTRINQIFEGKEQIALRRMEITKALLELDEPLLKQWQTDAGEDFFEEFEQVIQAASAFAFEEVGDDQYQIALTRYQCPYERLQDEDYSYYSPADALDNITIYELGMSFKSFEAFAETGELQHLHRLLAILYRPGKPATEENILSGYHGDIRLPLYKYETTIDARMDRMRRLPTLVSQVILFWFASCRQRIINSFPNIFKEPDGVQAEGNDYSWAGVILNLADGVVHEEAVSNKNYGTALVYLSMLEDRRKEQEMKQKLAARR